MDSALIDLQADLAGTHWWFQGRRRILTSIVGALPVPSPGVVVDLGCGVGDNTAALADLHDSTGFDTSELALGHARRRFPGVKFLAADITAVPRRAADADIVLLMDVLEHVAADSELLRSVIAVMHPGAYLIVTVPAHPELWSHHDVLAGHVRRYDRASLRALWSDLPVEEVMGSHFNTRLFQPARLVRRLRRRRAGGAGESDLAPVPGPLNRLLTAIFAGEWRRLVRLVAGRSRPYRTGLSLIAVLRRTDRPGAAETARRDWA